MKIEIPISQQLPLVAFAKYLLSLRTELNAEAKMPATASNANDGATIAPESYAA